MGAGGRKERESACRGWTTGHGCPGTRCEAPVLGSLLFKEARVPPFHPLYSAPLKVEKVVRVVLDGTHLIITCSFKQPTNIY